MKILSIIIVCTLFFYPLNAQVKEDSSVKTLHRLRCFNRQLDSLLNSYETKRLFISPVDKAILFESVFRNSNFFTVDSLKFELKDFLQLLTTQRPKGNDRFRYNIVRIMYHLCPDDYSTYLNYLLNEYHNNNVDLDILLYSIVTFNEHYSNIVVENYANTGISKFLERLSQDKDFMKKTESKIKGFTKLLNDIKNGIFYQTFQRDQFDWFFVIKSPTCK